MPSTWADSSFEQMLWNPLATSATNATSAHASNAARAKAHLCLSVLHHLHSQHQTPAPDIANDIMLLHQGLKALLDLPSDLHRTIAVHRQMLDSLLHGMALKCSQHTHVYSRQGSPNLSAVQAAEYLDCPCTPVNQHAQAPQLAAPMCTALQYPIQASCTSHNPVDLC